MALSDYTQAELAAVAKTIGALRGDAIDYSSLSESTLQRLIKRSTERLAADQGRHNSLTNNGDEIAANNPRETAKTYLKDAIGGGEEHVITVQHLLLANGYDIELDDALDNKELDYANTLYTAYHKGMAADAIHKAAQVDNAETARIEAEQAAEKAAAEQAAADLQNNIAATKAGLIKMGYLPADTAIDGEWDGECSQALSNMMRDHSEALQNQSGAAFQAHGNIVAQYRAIHGDTMSRDMAERTIANPQALTTIVGQIVTSAHPDIRDELTSGNPEQIKLAQGVLALAKPDAGITVNGTLDRNTALNANEYFAEGHQGLPAYLTGTDGQNIDWAQLDAAAARGNLPVVEASLSAADLAAYHELKAVDPEAARNFYADTVMEDPQSYAAALKNQAAPAPIPVPKMAASTPAGVKANAAPDELVAADARLPTHLQQFDNPQAGAFYAILPGDRDALPENAPPALKGLVSIKEKITHIEDSLKQGNYEGSPASVKGNLAPLREGFEKRFASLSDDQKKDFAKIIRDQAAPQEPMEKPETEPTEERLKEPAGIAQVFKNGVEGQTELPPAAKPQASLGSWLKQTFGMSADAAPVTNDGANAPVKTAPSGFGFEMQP